MLVRLIARPSQFYGFKPRDIGLSFSSSDDEVYASIRGYIYVLYWVLRINQDPYDIL